MESESFYSLILGPGERSFLELAVVDVRRYVLESAAENEKRVVLVFPPLSERHRFLINTLVRSLFTDLRTISIGSGCRSRAVVYHSSLHSSIERPTLCETEPIEMREDNNANMHRVYRTYSEKSTQENLFHSPISEKKVDKCLGSTQREKCKRPDITLYAPKARRNLANNFVSKSSGNITTSSNSLHITSSTTPVINTRTQDAHQAIFNDISSQISECSPSSLLNDVNNTIKVESSIINQDDSENSMPVNLTDFQTSNICRNNTVDNLPELREIKKSVDQKIVDNTVEVVNENNRNELNNEQHNKMQIKNEIANTSDVEMLIEYNSGCPHLCFNDSWSEDSCSSTDEEEKKLTSINEKPFYQQSSKVDDNKIDTNEQKKKMLEELNNKKDDYTYPLLMKELVSKMDKLQVKNKQEDNHSHQIVEDHSGNRERVIEVYGFSTHLKLVDLMNQFATFRKNQFEIVEVDTTHALAVFENSNLADRALNTPFALVKTRPLKNATMKSKLKAKTVASLPTTRPKICVAVARRLVSRALGLKLNVPEDILNAERAMLATAKEKKIRDVQQKHCT